MAKIIVSHPTGNANVRAAVVGLHKRKLVAGFYTAIAVFNGTFLSKISRISLLKELQKREFDDVLIDVTHSHPLREAGRIIASKFKLNSLIQHEKGFYSVDSVYRDLDKHVAKMIRKKRNKLSAVYSYEDGAVMSFREAKKNGVKCLYDLPIGYWRSMHQLLEIEKAKYPAWAATMTGFNDSPEKLNNKDEELRLADHIYVASSFTRETLKQYQGNLAPVSVIPYGFPEVIKERVYDPLSGRKLRLLFVGGLSQRKGIANLFEAVSKLTDEVEVTIVGNKMGGECEPLDTALSIHKWIPSLPHAQVLELMRQHDVFVFPSLFEGFGLVITEAMSQGTPVIATERTAGPDIIQNNVNGWLIKAGDTQDLILTLQQILADPSSIEKCGRAAMETARKRPWSVYGEELSAAVKSLL